MKGVSYITDRHNKRKAIIIDLKIFKKNEEQIEDLLDVIIAESRAEEKSIPFENVVKSLKNKGRL